MKPVPIRRKPKICAASKDSGDPCRNAVLTPEGLQRMLAANISLVADPGQFCSYHARTEGARRKMQQAGGANSRNKPKPAPPDPPEMPREIVNSSYGLIRELLEAKLPTIPAEIDWRKASVGVYLASRLFQQPDDIGAFTHSLLGVDTRTDVNETAEQTLHDTIEALPYEQRDRVWELLAAS